MRGLSWFSKMVFIANIVFAFLLLLSTFSPSIEPIKSKFIFLLGLGYPGFLLSNILFVLYWIRKKRLQMILSLAVIIFGYSNLTTLFATNISSKKTTETDFTIMSFNVRLFNKYGWLEDPEIDRKIFEYIKDQNPDIVAFQEFGNRDTKGFGFISRMKKLGYKYYDLEPKSYANKEKRYFGLATFSKYKTVAEGVAYQYETKKGNPKKSVSIFTDIDVKGQIIRVYNTHLKSLGFQKDDYEFVENIQNNNEKETLSKSKGIASKILQAAYKRATETEVIGQHVKFSEYPTILVGDFNEPPYTYSYKQLTANLTDSFLEHGFGLGTTFDGIATIPGLRLDFMLHSSTLTSNSFKTGPSGLSDHRPLVGKFIFSK